MYTNISPSIVFSNLLACTRLHTHTHPHTDPVTHTPTIHTHIPHTYPINHAKTPTNALLPDIGYCIILDMTIQIKINIRCNIAYLLLCKYVFIHVICEVDEFKADVILESFNSENTFENISYSQSHQKKSF